MKKLLISFIVIVGLLITGLYAYKYVSTKNISEEANNSSIKIFKHKNLIFKYGNKGDYPLLQVSKDSKDWRTINLRGFILDAIPSGSRFDDINSNGNTIWFYHLKSCIECDCSNLVYSIYYSHDNGDTWDAISPKGTCASVNFYNDKDGIMIYGEGKALYTVDGGKTWQDKKTK